MNRLVSFFRRKILRIPADRWNYQYGRGEWEGLAAEHARFDAVIALIREHSGAPSILEVGCGKALMLQRMKPGDYSYFTGVDLSEVAIAFARQWEAGAVRFVCADMQSFQPDRKYDVIAFNESLYYAKDPAATFDRYLAYLNPGGSIIVTAFSNKYTAALWPALEGRHKPRAIREVQVDGLTWDIKLYTAGQD